MGKVITVEAIIQAPVEIVWNYWTTPADIKNWCHASDDWGVGEVSNDVRVGGKFSTIMAAKDGSASFDFNGVYTTAELHRRLEYVIEDGRTVSIIFEPKGDDVLVTETFEMENENSEELQRSGWQAILNNFKIYTESK